MYIRQGISVGNLLLDLSNYRHGKAASQKEARDAIIAEQGKKLVNLAKDIAQNGLNPFDLPLVIDADDGNKNFIVIEGNRRLTAVNLMMKPELAEGTPVHAAFKRLNKNHADAIPKVFDCVIAPNKKTGLIWINRKHANGLEGAGTEQWSSMAKARADAEQGTARPDLDAVNYVLTNSKLDAGLRAFLEGSKFNITTLERLLTTKEAQAAVGFSVQEGKLVSEENGDWLRDILTDIVSIIATGEHNGEKFTERNIDSQAKRTAFSTSVISNHPKKAKADKPWVVTGKPTPIKLPATVSAKSGNSTSTPSTDDQPNLIPKKFKLELPSGKINDIFTELKKLDVINYRHAASVLFRVFFELTLDAYITKHGISLPIDGKGHTIDKLSVRLAKVVEHSKENNLFTEKELKPINVAIADKNSLVAPDTLNAYVHSLWLNPDPLQLKLTWVNVQLFIERLWNSKK
jgi:hypothetical protein